MIILVIGGILCISSGQQKWLVLAVARYKEHARDSRDTPQNSNCNKLYSRHVPVVGVSVVCAVPNGTFIALAPRSLHLAEFRHPQFMALLRLIFFVQGHRSVREGYVLRSLRHIYLSNLFKLLLNEQNRWIDALKKKKNKKFNKNLMFFFLFYFNIYTLEFFLFFVRLTFLNVMMKRYFIFGKYLPGPCHYSPWNDSPWCVRVNDVRGKKREGWTITLRKIRQTFFML